MEPLKMMQPDGAAVIVSSFEPMALGCQRSERGVFLDRRGFASLTLKKAPVSLPHSLNYHLARYPVMPRCDHVQLRPENGCCRTKQPAVPFRMALANCAPIRSSPCSTGHGKEYWPSWLVNPSNTVVHTTFSKFSTDPNLGLAAGSEGAQWISSLKILGPMESWPGHQR